MMHRRWVPLFVVLSLLVASVNGQVDNGPCTCSVDGNSGSQTTGIRGCGDHVLDGDPFCYVIHPENCSAATQSAKFPGAAYKTCSIDDALFTAVKERNVEAVEEMLIQKGSNLNNSVKYVDSMGVVHVAARNGQTAMVDLLLIYGFDHCGEDRNNQPANMICADQCLSESDRLQIKRLFDFQSRREPCPFDITSLAIGAPAPAKRYPYIVSLRQRGSRAHYCGGTLIDSRVVLTAAHCIDARRFAEAEARPTVYVGGYRRDLLGLDSFQVGSENDVEVFGTFATVEHPEWDGSFGNGFDIALILLTGSSTGETVTLGPVSEGQEVATLGWGRVAGAGVFPLVLQEAREMEVTVQQCIEIYKDSLGLELRNMVCAGTGTKDYCPGDDGGPLLKLRERNPGRGDSLVGVAHKKPPNAPCGTVGIPGVYSRLTLPVREWVNNEVQTLRGL